MNKEQIKKIITTNTYDCLRTDPLLGENIMLLSLTGSRAYGTSIDDENYVSDIDLRGIYTPTARDILTMRCETGAYQNVEFDIYIYSLYKGLQLLYRANPNVIEFVGARDCDVIICSPEGKLLRKNIDLFLSQLALKTYWGYAKKQLDEACAEVMSAPSIETADAKSYKKFMHGIRVLLSGMELSTTRKVNVYREHDRGLLLDIRKKKIPLQDMLQIKEEAIAKFQYAEKHTILPEVPDQNKIDELTITITSAILDKYKNQFS